jgi:cytochrome c-type biogenesis protein CcmE|tara:strand:+ start:860 stop:1282 length:423 start_codon:yes stop_codon:yes gene_type:complete
MYGKKVKLRILFLLSTLILFSLIIFLFLKSLDKNVVYFISPTDIKSLPELSKKKIRVGGMVKKNSLVVDSEKINFVITDFKNEIQVTFSGTVPNLFSEEKGVVAEGYLKDRNFLIAKKILAKHDENYMPPEVKEALEGNK